MNEECRREGPSVWTLLNDKAIMMIKLLDLFFVPVVVLLFLLLDDLCRGSLSVF